MSIKIEMKVRIGAVVAPAQKTFDTIDEAKADMVARLYTAHRAGNAVAFELAKIVQQSVGPFEITVTNGSDIIQSSIKRVRG